jgi:hypothetical protein
MNFDQAAALLADAGRYCEGASALAELGDVRALPALVKAYDSRMEGGKGCLLQAMQALGPVAAAPTLVADAATATSGYRLMGMFPDDSHLPLLVAGVTTPDARQRFVVLRALSTQLQTERWEAAMIGLLEHPAVDVRSSAIEALSRRTGDVVHAALSARRERETDDRLRARLEMIGP